jgi:hypothetical protein
MPAFFKYGTYVSRQEVSVKLSDAELKRIPAGKAPVDGVALRSVFGPVSGVTSIDDIANPLGFLFNSEQPLSD